jgi:excisionase family DNA binding protein
MTDTTTDLLTTPQVAELLGVSPLTLSRWRVKDKGPRCALVGKGYLYERRDVLDWLETQKQVRRIIRNPHAETTP